MDSSSIPSCLLDPSGTFKYIQIKIKHPGDPPTTQTVVRGFNRHGHHMDIFTEFCDVEMKDFKDLEPYCPGGGRIKMSPEKKDIFVYGYSQSYGQADHAESCEIIKTAFPDYKVDWSNEGY